MAQPRTLWSQAPSLLALLVLGLSPTPAARAALSAEEIGRPTAATNGRSPLGGGIGHIFRLGRLPVNAQIGGYYNVVAPDNGADWQLRAQIQLMFPK